MSQIEQKICTICLQEGHHASNCPSAKYLPPQTLSIHNVVKVTKKRKLFDGFEIEEYQFFSSNGSTLLVEVFLNDDEVTLEILPDHDCRTVRTALDEVQWIDADLFGKTA